MARAAKEPPPEDSIAWRLRSTREKYKITRWAMTGAAQLTRGHYGRIEDLHRRNVSSDACRQIVMAFAKFGVRVSLDWLIAGQGNAPTRIRHRPGWNEHAWKAQQAEERQKDRQKKKTNAGT